MIVVLDVNETLLDLGALDPLFASTFGDAAVRREWFGEMLQVALTTTVTGRYVDFGRCAAMAYDVVCRRHGVAGDFAPVRQGMLNLPAHPEVPAALRRLREAGLRLATLTNSVAEVGERQIRSAGLHDLVELAISADEVRRLKPAPEPYRHAASRLGVPIGDLVLVAAHGWDIAGAAAAGCRTAFVARPGKVLPDVVTADVVGADLAEVADALLAPRALSAQT